MVEIETHGDVAVVRIARPPANAIDLELLAAVDTALTSEAAGARALVLTGLEGFFSAGVDLRIVPTYDADQQAAMVTGINRLLTTAYGLEIPLVAAVSGHAIAGGLVIALCCDYRLVADGPFKFGLTEAAAGVPFPAAAMAIVRAELSAKTARYLCLACENVDVAGALERGLFDERVPSSELVAAALARAKAMAAMPADAYGRTKAALRAEALAHMREVLEKGSDPLLAGWLGNETAEAAASLLRGGKA